MCKDNSIYIPLKVSFLSTKHQFQAIKLDLAILIVIDPKVGPVCGKVTLHIYFSDSDIAEKKK